MPIKMKNIFKYKNWIILFQIKHFVRFLQNNLLKFEIVVPKLTHSSIKGPPTCLRLGSVMHTCLSPSSSLASQLYIDISTFISSHHFILHFILFVFYPSSCPNAWRPLMQKATRNSQYVSSSERLRTGTAHRMEVQTQTPTPMEHGMNLHLNEWCLVHHSLRWRSKWLPCASNMQLGGPSLMERISWMHQLLPSL